MKTSTSISIDSRVLAAAKSWSIEEHRPFSHQVEMILTRALAAREQAKAAARKRAKSKVA